MHNVGNCNMERIAANSQVNVVELGAYHILIKYFYAKKIIQNLVSTMHPF